MFRSVGFKPNGGQMVDLESKTDFIMLTRRYPCIYSLYDLYYRGYLSLGGYIFGKHLHTRDEPYEMLKQEYV